MRNDAIIQTAVEMEKSYTLYHTLHHYQKYQVFKIVFYLLLAFHTPLNQALTFFFSSFVGI